MAISQLPEYALLLVLLVNMALQLMMPIPTCRLQSALHAMLPAMSVLLNTNAFPARKVIIYTLVLPYLMALAMRNQVH